MTEPKETVADLLARVIGGIMDRKYPATQQWTCDCGLRSFVTYEAFLRHTLSDCPLRKRAS